MASAFIWLGQTSGFGFIADDFVQILGNPAVTGHQWTQLWTTGTWPSMGAAAPYFRPLQMSLFSLQQGMFGSEPAGYHFMEAILAGLAGVTWIAFCKKLGFSRTSLLFIALIWAASPGNASTIAWISCSADCLCVFLGLLAVAGWVYADKPRQWAAASLVWGLALLAKEWAVLWPVFALALLAFLRPEGRWAEKGKEALRRLWTAGLVLVGWLFYRVAVLGTILGRASHPQLTPWTTARITGEFFFDYIRSLAAFYPAPLWPTLWPQQATWTGLLLGTLSLTVLALWTWWLAHRGSRVGAICAAMIPIFLSPALLIGHIPWPVVFNVRYLFFVTPFFSVALAETLVRVTPPRKAAAIVAAYVAVAWLCQIRDIRPWHDQGTFYQAAVERSPDSAAALVELARIRAQEARQGQAEEREWALSGFLRAVELTRLSHRADLLPIRMDAEDGAATILLAEKRPVEVAALLGSSPDRDDARLANALAGAEMALHHDQKAEAVLTAALQAHPDDYGLHARRAWLLATQRACAAAREEEQQAGRYAQGEMSISFQALSAMLDRACREGSGTGEVFAPGGGNAAFTRGFAPRSPAPQAKLVGTLGSLPPVSGETEKSAKL